MSLFCFFSFPCPCLFLLLVSNFSYWRLIPQNHPAMDLHQFFQNGSCFIPALLSIGCIHARRSLDPVDQAHLWSGFRIPHQLQSQYDNRYHQTICTTTLFLLMLQVVQSGSPSTCCSRLRGVQANFLNEFYFPLRSALPKYGTILTRLFWKSTQLFSESSPLWSG